MATDFGGNHRLCVYTGPIYPAPLLTQSIRFPLPTFIDLSIHVFVPFFVVLQHMPTPTITDIMCRVGPIVHGLCPTAAPNKGALPRVGEANEHGVRKVDIPALGSLGKYVLGADDVPEPVSQQECTQNSVYNLLRDAATSPPAQRLDFGQLLHVSACRDLDGTTAVAFVLLARGRLRNLRRQSQTSMDLFEMVAVLNVRFTKVVAFMGDGQDKELPPAALVEKEQVD